MTMFVSHRERQCLSAAVMASLLGCSSICATSDPRAPTIAVPLVRLVHLPGFEIAPSVYSYLFKGRERPQTAWDLRISADGRVERGRTRRGSYLTESLAPLEGARLRKLQKLVEEVQGYVNPVRELPEEAREFHAWCPIEDAALDVILIKSPQGGVRAVYFCDEPPSEVGPVADLRKAVLGWYPVPRMRPQW